MYIVAIAWIYVTLLMALTEPSVTAGVLSFGFYGLAPLALLLWLVGTPQRRRRQAQARALESGMLADVEIDQMMGEPDRRHPGADQ